MVLAGGTTPARTNYSGEGVIKAVAGRRMRILLNGGGQAASEEMDVTVPEGENWRIVITIGVEVTKL